MNSKRELGQVYVEDVLCGTYCLGIKSMSIIRSLI